jgi:hypothetical protein
VCEELVREPLRVALVACVRGVVAWTGLRRRGAKECVPGRNSRPNTFTAHRQDDGGTAGNIWNSFFDVLREHEIAPPNDGLSPQRGAVTNPA